MMNDRLNLVLIAALALLVACKPQTDASLSVDAPYAYAPLASGGPGVAYFTLANAGTAPIKVSGFASDCFAAAELHTSVVDNGISKMRPIEMVEVPALSSLSLRPGGLHLMLLGARDAVAAGSSCNITLHYLDEQQLSFEVALLDRSRYRPAEPVK